MRCPRREENYRARMDKKAIDQWKQDNTCSYCGGLKPELFLMRIAEHEEIIPTDKNYKVYLRNGHQKFYFHHFTEEQQNEFIQLYNNKALKIAYPGHFYQPPFFVKEVAK